MKFKVGDKVTCNGNNQAQVIQIEHWANQNLTMVTLRLWDGFRVVGETQMSESALEMQQPNN
jgi:hypothetical protein